jgi:hypothetical protein
MKGLFLISEKDGDSFLVFLRIQFVLQFMQPSLLGRDADPFSHLLSLNLDIGWSREAQARLPIFGEAEHYANVLADINRLIGLDSKYKHGSLLARLGISKNAAGRFFLGHERCTRAVNPLGVGPVSSALRATVSRRRRGRSPEIWN